MLKVKNVSSDFEIGRRLEIVPNHVCAVINLFDELVGVRKEHVELTWPITARGKVR